MTPHTTLCVSIPFSQWSFPPTTLKEYLSILTAATADTQTYMSQQGREDSKN